MWLRCVRAAHAALALHHLETVVSLADGGMGSFQFVYEAPPLQDARCLAVAECLFSDQGQTPVLATLCAYPAGRLHELAVWKANFSPLQAWLQTFWV